MAWQTRRPWKITRWLKSVHSFFGTSSAISASTLTGSSSAVQPNRRTSRPKWVSTVSPGTPNALPRTTFAVLRPDPGQRHQVRHPAGHLAVEPLDQRLAEPEHRVGLGPEEAGGLEDLLQLVAVGAGQRDGVG